MKLSIDHIQSPIGTVLLVANQNSLCALDFGGCDARMRRLLQARHGDVTFEETDDPHGFSGQIRAYFAGRFDAVDDLPVETGGTPFQRRVWCALRDIPAGTTVSYGVFAQRIGKPTASRAVGLANSLNPVAIVVPCHRVIGANGTLTGYAGGLERKRWLLEHEGVDLSAQPAPVRQLSFELTG